MMLPVLIALTLLAETPATALTPAVPAVPAGDVADSAAAVLAEIDRLMTPWKGKSLGQIQGRLGLTDVIKEASDGKVVFWRKRAETMACGVDAGGAMRCASTIGAECLLGVAVNKEGKVTTWKVSGGADACRAFVKALSNP